MADHHAFDCLWSVVVFSLLDMEEKKPQPHFYVSRCPICSGQGCATCRSQGLGLWYSDFATKPRQYVIIWDKQIDWSHIILDRIEKFSRLIWQVGLLIFAVVGIVWGLAAYEPYVLNGKIISLDFWPLDISYRGWPTTLVHDWRTGFLCLAVLAALYLYSRLDRLSDKKQKVLKKSWQARVASQQIPTAPLLGDIIKSNLKKIDASLACDEESLEVVRQAWRLAKNWRHAQVLPIHFLAALLSAKSVSQIFARLGVDWQKMTEATKQALASLPRLTDEPIFGLAGKSIMLQAYQQAYYGGRDNISPAEILLAVDSDEHFLSASVLEDLGIDLAKIRNVTVWLQINQFLVKQWKHYHSLGLRRPKGDMNKAMTALMTPFLDQFSSDLTRQAMMGGFGPVVGRTSEIEEILRLAQSQARGIVLVGPPGVGKTALIESLAQKMIADDVPEIWRDKRLVSISVSRLLAGADAALANQRLLQIFYEIQKAGNIIVVIENIHDLVGISVGNQQSLDLAEVLGNYLAKSQTMVVATSTPEDYHSLDGVPELKNLLEKVLIDEPAINEAIQMTASKIGSFEYQQGVYFSYDAVAKAVELSARLLHDYYLPAKAINLLQEVAVAVGTHQQTKHYQTVTAEDVTKLISQKTNVPLTNIDEQESEKLTNLEEKIANRVIGQSLAVKSVAAALRRARAQVRDTKKPIANFLFVGPTGVGKTELAKTIADVYFGDEKRLLRFDMSEYQTQESLYRLIGSPGGGSQRGLLTDQVHAQPFALILFDEIEKAHPDILNVFLQVMDDGRLTDATGKTIDFTNTIIIMTSNAATSFISQQLAAGQTVVQVQQQLVNQELLRYFRPEFLNRFDSIELFSPLTMTEVVAIAKLLIKKSADRLVERGITLQVSPAAVTELANQGFDPQYGARPLRRVIQQQIDDVLAKLLIEGRLHRRDVVMIDTGGQVNVRQS